MLEDRKCERSEQPELSDMTTFAVQIWIARSGVWQITNLRMRFDDGVQIALRRADLRASTKASPPATQRGILRRVAQPSATTLGTSTVGCVSTHH